MTLNDICFSLKEMGVVEIILDVVGEVPQIEFNGRDETGDYFHLKATNADFAEHGI